MFRGRSYDLDPHGFLDPPNQWDENFAEGMAAMLGVQGGLTENHWKVIRYLRGKFLGRETVPFIIFVCLDNRLRLHRFRALFPAGYLHGACKIAGIDFAFITDTNYWLVYEHRPAVETRFEVTEKGFLKSFDTWNERFAHRMIKCWGFSDGVSEPHWKVIRFLREYHSLTRTHPTMEETCSFNRLGLRKFRRLFPPGFVQGACKAAGLPPLPPPADRHED
ncbi:MAG: TusE/DsrC/DsvC family sulfur relay protein [Planctomycetota bacterium]|jgi:tRNA 2-thiouridine synthesizing protein E